MKRSELASSVKYDIRRLSSNKPSQEAWKGIWGEIKTEIDIVLRAGNLSISLFEQSFHLIELTADPRIFVRFIPSKDRLWLSIWGLMFHPPFELAGMLVQENDHRKYHQESRNLLASANEIREFLKLHMKEIELRGYMAELNFLRQARPSLDPKWIIFLRETQVTYDLDEQISAKEKMVDKLSRMDKQAVEYGEKLTDAALDDLIYLMKCLNIELNRMKEKIASEPALWETDF